MNICQDCNEELIYCYGKIKRPFFRHNKYSNCISNGGELIQHLRAKYIIEDFLNKGNTITIINIYQESYIKLEQNDTIAFDQEINNQIYDIVIINNNCLKYIINIYNKHKQKRKEEYLEFDTKEILDSFYNNGILHNIANFSNYETIKQEQVIIIENNLDKILSDLYITFTNNGAENQFFYCNIPWNKIWQILVNGKTVPYIKVYNYDYFETNNNLWNLLKLYGKCIKCLKQHRIEKYKPYCSYCYKKIKKCNYELSCQIQLTNFKIELRHIFDSIIDKLPCGNIRLYDKCKLCNHEYIADLFCNIYFQNKYLHVCYNCLYNNIPNKKYFDNIIIRLSEYLNKNIVKLC